jgi:kynurenine formamidase
MTMLSEPDRIVDLSFEIYVGAPTYPGDPAFRSEVHDTVASAGYNLTTICLGTHQGTHLDAPYHIDDRGGPVDRIDLGRCVGNATLIDLSHKKAGEIIDVADLVAHERDVQPGARLILRFGWDREFPAPHYFTDFPSISRDLARWFADRRIGLLGSDAAGPSAEDWRVVHQILLGADIVVVESLTHLEEIPPGPFFFAAAPLRVRGGDGSPVRAFAVVTR